MTEKTAYQVQIFNELLDKHFTDRLTPYGFQIVSSGDAVFDEVQKNLWDMPTDHYPDGHAFRVYKNATTAIKTVVTNYSSTIGTVIHRLVDGKIALDNKGYLHGHGIRSIVVYKSPKSPRKRFQVLINRPLPKGADRDDRDVIYYSYEEPIRSQAEALENHCRELLLGDFSLFDQLDNLTREEWDKILAFPIEKGPLL